LKAGYQLFQTLLEKRKKMRYFLFIFMLSMIFTTPSLAFGNYKTGIIAFERGDYKTALKEFKDLAEQKDSRGQYGMGLMYDLGTGVSTNFEESSQVV
jgi:hypothetical protein